ncbi:MAG: methionyl-tRNA formyltransferase [Candidatus Yanofskybacteria bacterium]|nr:methionyl-tRNA formyltransferase [Candidatus Yanofskybacteria bacterium]
MNRKETPYVFFGTAPLGAIVLDSLVKAGFVPSCVVTTPDKPAGRKQVLLPSPVKEAAQRCGLKILQPEQSDLTLNDPDIQQAEFIVLAAYGKILPKELVELPPKGALNVHPSLLPKYRGPSPIQSVLLAGEQKTGVSIMLMDEEIDHGPLLAQEEYIIPSNARQPELHKVLAELGGDLLARTLPRFLAGEIPPIPQNHEEATYTKHITREDGKIDWALPAFSIERKIRAFDPWPGTFTFAHGKRVKILEASAQDQEKDSVPGKTLILGKSLGIQTGKGILVVRTLQKEGKNPMSSEEFLFGHPSFPGTILE